MNSGHVARAQTTLLKAIAEGKVDGFPPKDVLRTVYTEHEIKQELAELSVVDYVFADEVLKGMLAPCLTLTDACYCVSSTVTHSYLYSPRHVPPPPADSFLFLMSAGFFPLHMKNPPPHMQFLALGFSP